MFTSEKIESVCLGRDLTEWARCERLDPVVGREREIDEVLRILCRRTKSNPLLLGDPGVGKTALVEGLAQLMVAGNVPRSMRGRRLFELQLGSLMAGTQFRGDLEKRVQDFLRVAREERTIVFIDEIHLLVVAGRGSGMDAANLLKPILARGEVPCIGATTPAEAVEMFRVDPAMERRFQSVVLDEPSPEAVHAILRASRPRLEVHHGLRISDAALETALALSLQTPASRKNPDRALDILEDACAAEQLRLSRAENAAHTGTAEYVALEAELKDARAALDLQRHVQAKVKLEQYLQTNTGEAASSRIESILGSEHVIAGYRCVLLTS